MQVIATHRPVDDLAMQRVQLLRWSAPSQGRLTKEDVDLRMIKALADLPGDRGMEAVDRFSGSSLETVRSKTGFMVRRSLSLSCSRHTVWDVYPRYLFRL